MRDTWCCRQYPGGLPVGVIHEEHTRDTCRTQRLPGNIIRETRGALGGFREGPISLGTRDMWRTRTAPGGFSRLGFPGHVVHSKYFRTWSHGLGTRGHVVLSQRSREYSLGRSLGTRGTFRRFPKKVSKEVSKGLS